MGAARAQGSRVEVASQRTPTRTVYANPGGTLTAEFSVLPTRVKRDGRWVPVDTSVVRRRDGSLEPRAALSGLSLSGGGASAALVRMVKDGKSLALFWPGVLPAPRVDGSVVSYPDVLPGVDLVMHVEPYGYRQHLVVTSPEAARNPALARLEFRVEAAGLRVTADEAGALRVVDDAGEPVFVAPPSVMWDSSGPAPSSPATARSASVGVSVAKGALVLRPDRAFLADPAVEFPVTIDPNMRTWNKRNWATVLSGKPNTEYWWTSGSPPWAQVGQCYQASGECNGIGEARAYFQFDTRSVAGKRIMRTEFRSEVVYSPNCSARNHQLFVVPGAQINAGTNWNNMPGGGLLSTASAAGVWDSCPGRKPVGFRFPAGHESDGIGAISSFFLKAADTGDQLAWRKYDPAKTRLSVTYNTAPSAPSSVMTDPRTPAPCRWCAGRSYVGDASIRLLATLRDPDGDLLLPKWRIKVGGVETAWDGPSRQRSGATHDTTVDLRNKDGEEVQWWVHGHDGVDWSPHAYGRSFVVDRQPPTQAPVVSSVEYPEDNRWHGGVGVAGAFEFTANGVGDIDHYLYGWSSPPSTRIDAVGGLSGDARVVLEPPTDGPQTLYVQSVDRAGHRSETEEHRIYVRAGNGALSQWSFEGNARDTAFLGDRHGTLHGTTSYVSGAVSNAVAFSDGGHMTAPNSVDPRGSFSVSAWVRVDDTVGTHTAVSEAGDTASAFQLGYRTEADEARWFFELPRTDSAGPVVDTALSANTAQTGAWTHLAGVYDAASGEARLFVNGEFAGRVAHAAGWETTGLVRVGNALVDGGMRNHWLGAVDEVRLYDRALADREIESAVSGANVQVAHWRFEDGAGSTARNAVESGPMARLTEEGASFAEQSGGNGALRLEGGYAETDGPLVRTDQSFSVAARVTLDRVDDRTYTVLSQDGVATCGFCLRYEGGGVEGPRWVFAMPWSDEVDPAESDRVSAPVTQAAGVPTHLVAVYDDVAKTMRLYVNGVSAVEGAAARPSAWNAGGVFALGRATSGGEVVQTLPGWIDEARVYGRTMVADEVRGIVAADGLTAGTWTLDGNATDSSGADRHGELVGGPEWVAGQTSSPDASDLAVRLGGSGQYLTAADPVNGEASFSVAAWARLDGLGDPATVVSQAGTNRDGFSLRALPDGQWAFSAPRSDDPTAIVDSAVSLPEATQVGVWTHLAGVYSVDRQRLELYVNGVLAGSAQHEGGFDALGDLAIGRAMQGDYFRGAIDDVNVYSRMLFADEIRTMAGRDLSLVHNWQLDESTGSTAADSVGVRGGTLVGDARFELGRLGNGVELNGTDAAVTTTGVDLRTDQSFTVGAWARFDSDTPCDLDAGSRCMSTAVSVDGDRTSKFRLGHVVDSELAPWGSWVFEMPEADNDGDAPLYQAALAVTRGEVDDWVHLVGVYDAQTQKTWLYVNGDRVDDGTLNTPWSATGGLQIGRGKVSGDSAQYWPGGVDDVRVYTGVQDKDRVEAWHRSYAAPPAAPLPTADLGYWTFDEGTGSTAADSSGNGRTLTLRDGAGWTSARSAWGGSFDGVGAYAETVGPVLDGTASFSVSVWASATGTGDVDTVVGQDGEQASTFALQYRPSDSRWVVRVPTDTGTVTLTSTEPASATRWTHVAVTYDVSDVGELRLYVNGSLSAVHVGVKLPEASGPLSVGRGRAGGANVDFFSGGIDDIRAFSESLTDAEIRKVYNDVYLSVHGYWRFDGTAGDDSWRQNPTTLHGSPSYVRGVSDRALRLNGEDQSATTERYGVPSAGSFTVSAWAKLARTDRAQTVLGEDGTRMSGYVLQYRPELNRWVFGAPTQDADGAGLVHATSTQPPTPSSWTHLTGVYDYPARQLRLYVDGQLVGTRDNVVLWRASGGLTIGRGKVDGEAAQFFAGDIDEVTTDMGAAADSEILRRASHPAPPAGQLGRFVNSQGDSYTASTDQPAPAGYHFAASLGSLIPADATDTRMLYACLYRSDVFTSPNSNCEGQTVLGEIGPVYASQPESPATVPLYRCNTGQDHFESLDSTCGEATRETVLGYTVAYAPLVRYNTPVGWDHATTVHGVPPGYAWVGAAGFTSLVPVPGGYELFSCRDGLDRFLSHDAGCEGADLVASIGWAWAQPPEGVPSVGIYRCVADRQRFVAWSETCEGQTLDRPLGYLVREIPGTSSADTEAPASALVRSTQAQEESVAGTRPPFPIVVGWVL